jgi:hypothetical protein
MSDNEEEGLESSWTETFRRDSYLDVGIISEIFHATIEAPKTTSDATRYNFSNDRILSKSLVLSIKELEY